MSEELKMYTKYMDGKPYQYRYGESWRSMQLMVDGGYPTPEEAKAAWEAEQDKTRVFCPNCGKRTNYSLSTRRVKVEIRGVKFTYPEEYAECVECYHEVYIPLVNDMNAKCRQRYYLAHAKLQK